MGKLRRQCCGGAVSLALLVVASANAGTVTYGPDTFGPATTNWSTSLSLPQWDPALFPGQVLTGVSFTLAGDVFGSASFESLDAAPATVTMSLQATITLLDPNNVPIVTVIPVANTSDLASAFDGVIDFGGTSGKSYTGLSGSASNSGISTNLPLFIGSGNVLLPVSATGTSSGSGAGNLITQFSTSAGALATVTYTFAAVPEVSTVLLCGLGGLAVVGGIVRRRRTR